jgi:hypothetical protein
VDTFSDIDMLRGRTVFGELDSALLAWRQVEVIAETERTRLVQIKDEAADLMDRLANVTAELELLKKRGNSDV